MLFVYWPDNRKEANQACRHNDGTQQFIKLLTDITQSARKLRNKSLKKSDFFIVKQNLPTESALENHSVFAVAESRVFEPFVCKLGIAAVSDFYDLQSCKHDIILGLQKVKDWTCPLCMCSLLANAMFCSLLSLLMMIAFEVLIKSLSICHELTGHSFESDYYFKKSLSSGGPP